MRDLDPCCTLCRHYTGVCLTRGTCDHHVTRQAELNRHVTVYSDPVGEQAVGNVLREQRKKNRRRRT